MKFLFLAILINVSSFAHASELKSLNCVTEYPSVSFVGTSDRSKQVLNILFINHNGSQFLPIHNGLITINDLEYLKSKASILETISKELRFSFTKEQCTLFQDGTFSCYRPYSSMNEQQSSIDLRPISLRSSILITQLSNMVFKEIELSMGLSDGINQYNISMKYTEDECIINSLSRQFQSKPSQL